VVRNAFSLFVASTCPRETDLSIIAPLVRANGYIRAIREIRGEELPARF
jgi:hypothetical protein